MYFFTLYQTWKRMFWVETCILQCIINSGMSVIWLRKWKQILSWCHFLIIWHPACSDPNSICCCAAERIDSDCIFGISSSKWFLFCCLKHWSLVFWIDVCGQYNSGNMPAHSPNSLSVSWFAFIRLTENPAISSDVMKDPDITLATTMPRLSICIGSTN